MGGDRRSDRTFARKRGCRRVDVAWQMLSAASQNSNIKLRRIAAALLEIMVATTLSDDEADAAARALLPPTWVGVGDDGLTLADRRVLGDERDVLASARDADAMKRDVAAEVRYRQADEAEVTAGAAAD